MYNIRTDKKKQILYLTIGNGGMPLLPAKHTQTNTQHYLRDDYSDSKYRMQYLRRVKNVVVI